MNWAQITMIVLISIDFGWVVANHGKPKGDYNALVSLISAGIWLMLLYYGGFWS